MRVGPLAGSSLIDSSSLEYNDPDAMAMVKTGCSSTLSGVFPSISPRMTPEDPIWPALCIISEQRVALLQTLRGI